MIDPDAEPTASMNVQKFTDDYVQNYEMLGEDEHGQEGYYHPTAHERLLILDAVNGLTADEEFVDLIAAQHAQRQARRAAEGCCLTCGAPAGDHWGNRCAAHPTTAGRD